MKLEVRVLLHETERLSKHQALPKCKQKWRSNEAIISGTKVGNYRQRSRLTTENQDVLLRVQREAPRDVEGSVRVGSDEDDRQMGCKDKEDVIR